MLKLSIYVHRYSTTPHCIILIKYLYALKVAKDPCYASAYLAIPSTQTCCQLCLIKMLNYSQMKIYKLEN